MHYRDRSPLLTPKQIGPFAPFLLNADIYKFCWARNPYHRFLSAYFDKIYRPGPFRDKITKELEELGRPLPPKTAPSLDEFLFAVEQESLFDMDPHWKPQYCLTLREMIDYDFIGRLEHFERDMQQVAKHIGFDYNRYIGIINQHKTQYQKPPDDYYTADLRKRVARLYAADFDYFGYSV